MILGFAPVGLHEHSGIRPMNDRVLIGVRRLVRQQVCTGHRGKGGALCAGGSGTRPVRRRTQGLGNPASNSKLAPGISFRIRSQSASRPRAGSEAAGRATPKARVEAGGPL